MKLNLMNGITTKLGKAKATGRSLRTTVPLFIIEQWDLKPGMELKWTIDIVNGELKIIVEPVFND